MIKPLTDLIEKELSGKKVLLRVDFNVPVADGKILEFYRVDAIKETVDYLVNRGAIVALLSHIAAISGFDQIFNEIKERLSRELKTNYINANDANLARTTRTRLYHISVVCVGSRIGVTLN